MPRQIHSAEQFEKLMPKAQEVRVVRTNDSVKIKLRTPDSLYTYKTNPDEAEDLIKSVKDIEVVELTPDAQKKGKESSKKEEEDSSKKNEEKKKTETKTTPQKKRKSK
jgi:hypothetical protein